MTAKDFDNLHDLLRDAEDFSEVQDAFFDLAERPGFFRAGAVWEDEVVAKAIGACVSSMLPEAREVAIRLVRLAEFEFVHGSLLVDGAMGSALYFEKSQMGLVALSDMGENALFARFTTSSPSSGISPN